MTASEKMRVLIGCECSGVVREEFCRLGHDAWSCDLLPSEIPGNHILGDLLNVLEEGWDLAIVHPPCTFLSVSGNRWFTAANQARFPHRATDRQLGVDFFMALVNSQIPRLCIENPVGFMSTAWREPTQVIQPFEFGDMAAKRTCLWLRGLPKLRPTGKVEPDYVSFPNGKRQSAWYYEALRLPAEQRRSVRSKTFPGIARAMATQWGSLELIAQGLRQERAAWDFESLYAKESRSAA